MVNLKSFWKRVEKTDGCWNWTGGKTTAGYGLLFEIIRDGKRIRRYAHRFMWELYNGKIPEGYCICHKCDNPGCVNPDHLFCGTKKDNHRDCMQKGRDNRGKRNGQALLTEKQVLDMRQLYTNGIPVFQIAMKYNAKWGTVYSVVKRLNWKYLP